MGLLTFLHLRRPSPWEPPTLLDSLLSSPLAYLLSLIYHALLFLRGPPFKPSPSLIRIVCLSDTHDLTNVSIPDGDLLIHAGDMSSVGTLEAIQKQVDWLAGLPHREKVVVAGNHDLWFDGSARLRGDGIGGKVKWGGVRYLGGQEVVEVIFRGGRKLNVWGAGGVPRIGKDGEHAFQYDRDRHPWKGRIPDETDILITHTPPRSHCDLGLGCDGLLEEVWRVKPKLHVFGHVHWGHGKEAIYFDECQKAYESLMTRTGSGFIWDLFPSRAWVDAVKVIWYGVKSIVWKWVMLGPGSSNNGGLMVNAAAMYGNTGKLGNKVIVVDL
ncbi:Metallo-dependent phosphatase-like protein [Immersiella caudata]|uniref:Metallo-dependent phosphatase-like protein n=1 Tax=Immersiella caudata TaxID=314043 RepID=A0AA39WQU6_9PEZI|nr:Metallo-dependent phosphatase-like protein [Immersiella caudata]